MPPGGLDASVGKSEHFDSWWPAEHRLGAASPEARTLEPREGGRWYERAADGRECDWGRVLAWEPLRRAAEGRTPG